MKSSVVFLFGAWSLLVLTPTYCDKITPSQAKLQSVSLSDYLRTMGKKLDCYFTIERDDRGPHRLTNFRKESSLSTAKISDNEQITSVEKLTMKLKKIFPKAEFLTSKHAGDHALVLHITDASLMESQNYVLNQKLSIKYSGLLQGLPDAIGTKLENFIGPPQTVTTEDLMKGNLDQQTRIGINVDNKAIRDTLTDAVPKLQDNRILWDAEVLTRDNKEVVEVKYFRPIVRH